MEFRERNAVTKESVVFSVVGEVTARIPWPYHYGKPCPLFQGGGMKYIHLPISETKVKVYNARWRGFEREEEMQEPYNYKRGDFGGWFSPSHWGGVDLEKWERIAPFFAGVNLTPDGHDVDIPYIDIEGNRIALFSEETAKYVFANPTKNFDSKKTEPSWFPATTVTENLLALFGEERTKLFLENRGLMLEPYVGAIVETPEGVKKVTEVTKKGGIKVADISL